MTFIRACSSDWPRTVIIISLSDQRQLLHHPSPSKHQSYCLPCSPMSYMLEASFTDSSQVFDDFADDSFREVDGSINAPDLA